MSICTQPELDYSPKKLIGEILEEAGLISTPQLETALTAQSRSSNFKLGEILASKGWLQQKTVDFLVDVFSASNLSKYLQKQPIGYYLQEAGLLNEEQIDSIIEEQKQSGTKFCYLAIIKGFLRPKTADFFLDNVAQKFTNYSTDIKLNSQNSDDKLQTIMLDNNYYEEIVKDQDVKLNDSNTHMLLSYDLEIQSSPVWIEA